MKLFTQLAFILVFSVTLLLALFSMIAGGKTTFFQSIVIILFIAAVDFFWAYMAVIRPLRELESATKKIKEGELDFTLETDSDSEMGDLIRSFEEMRLRLLESQNERLSSEVETRELIRNIAHDLKTPITTIRGYSEGILDGVAASPEKQEKYIKTIHTKAVEMTTLIDELSFYSKIDTNRIPYTFKKQNVNDYFSECAEALTMELSEKNIGFIYESSVSSGVRMIADPEQLTRVINNIISNSVKYMDKSEGRIRMTVTDTGDFIQCDITDNGCGVDKKDLPKLYDRFYRTDASRTSSTGGSGIGLSIVKKIIDDHGGSIWATGDLGAGLSQHFILRKTND